MDQPTSPPQSSSKTATAETSAKPYSLINAVQTIISVAIVMATLLTMWTPANLFSNSHFNELLLSIQQTRQETASILSTPTSPPVIRIGIVAGHWQYDSGAVCPDGLKEETVNLQIATLVRQKLLAYGYQVDLLQEHDPQLFEYRAAVLVSIHNDSCEYRGDEFTGFKVAAAKDTAYPERAARLTTCLAQRYQQVTGLRFHYNTVTNDMTDYHTFREINADTPAAIIETGFLNLDRKLLTENPGTVADGVVAGILCFLRNEDATLPVQ